MRIQFTLLGILLSVFLSAQDTLKFSECLNAAVENSPRLRDKNLIDEQGKLSIDNIRARWYPDMNINGKVSYQSDVVSLNIDIPGITLDIPEMPHEQFGLNLDVRQTLYDGGLSKQQKKFEQLTTEAAIKKVDVDMQSFKEQVSSIYFSILVLQENRHILEITLENLKAREKVLLSAVENGVAEENDLQVIRVEMMKLLQSLSEIDAGKSGAIKMLETYMDQPLEELLVLELPFLNLPEAVQLVRPELDWFDLQSEVLDAGKELTAVKRMPMIFAYGQAGVGRPGYNMLNDQVDGYYMLGAGLQWKVWDWNTTKREKQILETKKQVILNSKETFSRNIQAGLEKENESMLHYKNSLSLDDKMLEMRIDITSNASSKVDNGIISAAEYLQILNEESKTRVMRATHQLLLLKAMTNYNLLIGTL